MNWINSSAVRAGFGPPEWIVIAILLALLFVAMAEGGHGASDCRSVILTKQDRCIFLTGLAALSVLVGFLVWRTFGG
jgi:hypothetical protein